METNKKIEPMNSILLQQAADWFTSVKAPDLQEKVNEGFLCINVGNPIDGKHKKLFGFILFDYAMHYGPSSFIDLQEVAEQIGVMEEFKFYAKDWIEYADRQKQGDSQQPLSSSKI